MDTLKLKFKTSELLEIWQQYCELHAKLYEVTTDEYLCLLESDIEGIDKILADKNNLIETIKLTEELRQETNKELELLMEPGQSLSKINSLYELLEKNNLNTELEQLKKYNNLLLDMIDKIQEQNKKNQIFLNRAILSLQDLKDSFGGKKQFKTYGSSGVAKNSSVR